LHADILRVLDKSSFASALSVSLSLSVDIGALSRQTSLMLSVLSHPRTANAFTSLISCCLRIFASLFNTNVVLGLRVLLVGELANAFSFIISLSIRVDTKILNAFLLSLIFGVSRFANAFAHSILDLTIIRAEDGDTLVLSWVFGESVDTNAVSIRISHSICIFAIGLYTKKSKLGVVSIARLAGASRADSDSLSIWVCALNSLANSRGVLIVSKSLNTLASSLFPNSNSMFIRTKSASTSSITHVDLESLLANTLPILVSDSHRIRAFDGLATSRTRIESETLFAVAFSIFIHLRINILTGSNNTLAFRCGGLSVTFEANTFTISIHFSEFSSANSGSADGWILRELFIARQTIANSISISHFILSWADLGNALHASSVLFVPRLAGTSSKFIKNSVLINLSILTGSMSLENLESRLANAFSLLVAHSIRIAASNRKAILVIAVHFVVSNAGAYTLVVFNSVLGIASNANALTIGIGINLEALFANALAGGRSLSIFILAISGVANSSRSLSISSFAQANP
jgi:hypothetical protein